MECPKCKADIIVHHWDYDIEFGDDYVLITTMEDCKFCGSRFLIDEYYEFDIGRIRECNADGDVLEDE